MTMQVCAPATLAQYLADNTLDLTNLPIKVALLTSAYHPIGVWAASTAYGARVVRRPLTDNGHYYYAAGAGASDSGEPTWPTDGSSVVDGDITWHDMGTTLPAFGGQDATWLASSSFEISGTGYVAGGETLASVALVSDPSLATLGAADTVWSAATFSARWAQLRQVGTVNGVVDALIATILLDDTPADITVAGVDYTLVWGTDGVLQVPTACVTL